MTSLTFDPTHDTNLPAHHFLISCPSICLALFCLDTAVVLHSWPEKIKLSLIRFRTCTRKTTEIWQTSCVLNWKRKLMKDTLRVFSILEEISGTSTSATSRPKHVYADRWVGMQEGKVRLDPNRRKDSSPCALLGVGIPTEVDRNLRYSLSRRTSK